MYKKVLTIISLGLSLLSAGMLFLLLFVFGSATNKEQLVLGIWPMNVRTLLIVQTSIVLIIGIGNALLINIKNQRSLIFVTVSILAALVTAMDSFWLPYLAVGVCGLTGFYLYRELNRAN